MARASASTRSPSFLPARYSSPSALARAFGAAGPLPSGVHRDQREQRIARPVAEQLQLAVLVHRSQHRHRRRTLAVLAQALGPELPPPAAEHRQLVGIRPKNGRGEPALRRPAPDAAPRPMRRAHRPAPWPPSTCSSTACAPARSCLDVQSHHQAGQRAHHGQHRIAPAHAGGMIQLRARRWSRRNPRSATLMRFGDDGEMLLEIFDAAPSPARPPRSAPASRFRRCRRIWRWR